MVKQKVRIIVMSVVTGQNFLAPDKLDPATFRLKQIVRGISISNCVGPGLLGAW